MLYLSEIKNKIEYYWDTENFGVKLLRMPSEVAVETDEDGNQRAYLKNAAENDYFDDSGRWCCGKCHSPKVKISKGTNFYYSELLFRLTPKRIPCDDRYNEYEHKSLNFNRIKSSPKLCVNSFRHIMQEAA